MWSLLGFAVVQEVQFVAYVNGAEQNDFGQNRMTFNNDIIWLFFLFAYIFL